MNKELFIKGPVTPDLISKILNEQSTDRESGAFTIFLGQVRSDKIDGKEVTAIEYTAYESMAEKVFEVIRKDTFESFKLTKIIIIHSLGTVKSGEVSLFVLVAAGHRPDVFKDCSYIVEKIKKDLPVWGKEILEDDSYTWKKNNF
ncbi:MAG: molybdenum cofactor biosynthesis protein MoaE [Cytophagaceae bacterium]